MKRTRYSKVLQRGLVLTIVLVLTILPNSMESAARASRAPLESADQIAFVSNRDGNSEIYLMNMDETGLVRLTTNAATDEGPTWSPDGNWIAFHSNRVGYNQIFTMNADGSNQTRLISSAVIDEWPYWSPRGNKIAFARVADHNGDGLRSEVFIANSDGTDVRRLTYSSGSTNGYNTGGWPSGWSPDGSQLLFYWYREGYDQLWIMNSDGTNQRKLTTDSYWNAMPSMAPDGRKVAFASYRDGNYEIYTVNSDGTNATRLTNQAAEEWRPIWSQDGSKIIFESRRTGKTQIYSMSVDGSQQTRLTSSNSYDGQQAWRPMGSGASYTITGRVTDTSGSSIPGVTVWAGSSLSTTTDATGNYTFAGLTAGTYTISPSRYLYAFSPASRTVTVPPNATGQNFVQTPVVDLSVNRIEVAQVFADATTNPSGASVPLIAEKDSLVRVFVNVTGISALGGVTARLHVRDAQGVLHTLDEAYPPSAIWARQNPDRRLLQDTVNFRPPPEWLRGTIGLWADVDPGNIIPETDEGNNTNSTAFTATFEDGKQWRIAWTALGYFDGQSLHLPDRQVAGTADQRLRTLYPVGKSDVDYFFQPGYTEILGVPFDTHSAEYIKAANRFWKRVAADYGWAEGRSPDRLYGWIPGSARQPDTICGISDPDWPDYGGLGRVAVGADHCDKVIDGNLTTMPGANVFAHEIGHILSSTGLRHPLHAADSRYCFGSLGDPKSVYPIYKDPSGTAYPLGSIGAYGLDVARNWVLSPNTNYDFMAYCWPTWISPYHYVRLHDEFIENPSSAAGAQAGVAVSNQLLVSGLVYSPTLQTTLDPFYTFRSASTPDVDTGTAFCLELRDAGQGLLSKRCFDLAFHDIETDESSDIDSFTLAVPYPAGTTQIVLTHLGTSIATRAVSAHAPTVRLLSPNGGETWTGSGTHAVTWTASDLDGDPLHFALSYSTDGGASWIPAGLDLTGTQHALDVSMLPGGTSVLLRISATDGVNTTNSVSDGPFTVGRKAPMTFILLPEDGAHFFPGAAIWLEGRAFDLEDGTLDDAALRWSSDRDGVLGTGKLLIATLSPGEHTITLTATDSDGAQATATIRLSAGERLFLPVVLRGR